MTAQAPEAAAQPSRLTYLPALDGIRGISVLAVLLFHSELHWARGGYLGVSTFFTLSGFLITWLLLLEHRATGTIELRAFYARRARRLLPALGLTLAGVLAFGTFVADPGQVRGLRGDLLASLGYVANWRFAFSGESYSDLFGDPSPLLHVWSIAIEEQFYLLFPPAFALLLQRRGGHGVQLRALGAAIAASAGLLVLSGAFQVDRDLIYFGTHTRAAELLIGAALAVVVHAGWTGRVLAHLRWAGPLALLGMLAAWASVDQFSDALYLGGFAAYALLSAVVILAAATSGNVVQLLLRIEPLRQLGRISYGTYLFHWPIYLWLTPERTGLQDASLLGTRLAVTVSLALVSFHLLEAPIRTGSKLRGRHGRVALAVAAVALLLGAALLPSRLAPQLQFADPLDFQGAAEALGLHGPPTPPNPPGVDATRVAIFGDSIALTTSIGLHAWMNGDRSFAAAELQDLGQPGVIGVNGYTPVGCGILEAETLWFHGSEGAPDAACADWREQWASALVANRPDVVVIQLGVWEVVDRRLPDDDTIRAPGDPVLDEVLREQIRAATELVLDNGAMALWVLSPHISVGTSDGVPPSQPFPESDPARMDRYNEIVRAVVASFPDRTGTLDLQAHLRSRPAGEMDPAMRPDGGHYPVDSSMQLAADWFGPAIMAELERIRQ